MRECVRACARALAHARVCACVRACVQVAHLELLEERLGLVAPNVYMPAAQAQPSCVRVCVRVCVRACSSVRSRASQPYSPYSPHGVP